MRMFLGPKKLALLEVVLIHFVYNHTNYCLYRWTNVVNPRWNFGWQEFCLFLLVWGLTGVAVIFLLLSFFRVLKGDFITSLCTLTIPIFVLMCVVFAFGLSLNDKIIQTYIITIPLSIFLGRGMNNAYLNVQTSS